MSSTAARLAPHDLDAESAVLGACLANRSALSKVLPVLEPADFYSETHRRIYAAIKAASRDHEEIDGVVIGRYSDEATRANVFRLMESVPASSNAHKYAEVVKEASRARQVLDAADRIQEKCYSWDYQDAAGFAMSEIQQVAAQAGDDGAKPIAAAAEDLAALVRNRREEKGPHWYTDRNHLDGPRLARPQRGTLLHHRRPGPRPASR